MKHREKTVVEEGKVAFETLAGRRGGEGLFGIEDEADELARQTKLRRMAERIAAYDRGYEGKQRRCPRCGQMQRYKGDVSRDVVVDGGTLTVRRAYYYCAGCGQPSYPLDEKLGLGKSKNKGAYVRSSPWWRCSSLITKPRRCARRCWAMSSMRPVCGASPCGKPSGSRPVG